MSGPAIFDRPRTATRLIVGGRSKKMLRPVCDTCTEFGSPRGWWRDCTHNPYVGLVKKEETVPKYEDILDAEGEPTGQKRVTGTETLVDWVPRPNWKEVIINERVSGGRGMRKAQARGCILPSEVRSPEYPEGVAEACEFRGCFRQTQPDGSPLIETRNGKYCRTIEAKYAQIDKTGGMVGDDRFEVGTWPEAREKQRRQLDNVVI